MLAVKSDGTLWSWTTPYGGSPTHGQLGLGNTTNYFSPKQVGALTNWKMPARVDTSSSAIKTDGTLWTWGYNASGQLGLGNTTNYSSPKQVGALTNWNTYISGTLAIK
jgi:alpha-tubulin suppressor-like RCC1 family protein